MVDERPSDGKKSDMTLGWMAVVAAALHRDDGRWLMHQRPVGKHHAGLHLRECLGEGLGAVQTFQVSGLFECGIAGRALAIHVGLGDEAARYQRLGTGEFGLRQIGGNAAAEFIGLTHVELCVGIAVGGSGLPFLDRGGKIPARPGIYAGLGISQCGG